METTEDRKVTQKGSRLKVQKAKAVQREEKQVRGRGKELSPGKSVGGHLRTNYLV
jgi:hypothetical protein